MPVPFLLSRPLFLSVFLFSSRVFVLILFVAFDFALCVLINLYSNGWVTFGEKSVNKYFTCQRFSSQSFVSIFNKWKLKLKQKIFVLKLRVIKLEIELNNVFSSISKYICNISKCFNQREILKSRKKCWKKNPNSFLNNKRDTLLFEVNKKNVMICETFLIRK